VVVVVVAGSLPDRVIVWRFWYVAYFPSFMKRTPAGGACRQLPSGFGDVAAIALACLLGGWCLGSPRLLALAGARVLCG